MRLSRRTALIGGGGAALAAAGVAAAREHRSSDGAGRRRVDAPTRLDPPRATPLRHFDLRDPELRRFGALEFRSGLALSSGYRGFGGFSGIATLDRGERVLLVTDDGFWFRARIDMREGEMTGLSELEVAPQLGRDGAAMRRSRRHDSEGLTIAGDGKVYVSYERAHEIWRYDLLRQGFGARAEPVAVPADVKRLGANKSLESIAAPPAGHPLDGMLVTIAERPPSWHAQDFIPAWVVPTPGRSGGFAFSLQREDEFDISDAAFLPGGELLALERRFRLTDGVRIRLRRIAAAAIRPGARVAGERIFEAGMSHEIDNLEGLAVHVNERGETILTLCSDDNFNWFQRNLLLQFRYAG